MKHQNIIIPFLAIMMTVMAACKKKNTGPSVTAAFTYSSNGFQQGGDTVNFQNNSNYAKSYYWVFGDGSTSTEPHPVHVYKNDSTYKVSLIAYGPTGTHARTNRTARQHSDWRSNDRTAKLQLGADQPSHSHLGRGPRRWRS